MPANHCVPHTAEARAKMRAARLGKPNPCRHRQHKEIDGVVSYRCGRCGGFFPREMFHKDKRTLLGMKSDCKSCHNACNVASRNKENKRAKAIHYEATRRARKAGANGDVTASDWNLLLEILGKDCLKCGIKCEPTQDHIIPLSKGGAHHPTNLQPLCRHCNERKQARILDFRSAEQIAVINSTWVIEFKRIKP